ncbi:MucBP domain-containing protein [Aerococcaceae bacterium zg-A91]|uniref:MucBP domain-containing protein n=1 Tax=Aerococcaceae bacterium zg-1292 TaxID=2774330 RepID=UPI001BD869C5|nr:MucBP domain-containing protein [Aerococcaceae bacterium zg-A91]
MFLKKKQRFSLRKYKIGVCSVLLGTTFVTGAHQVSAEEAGLNEAVSSTTERVEEVSEAEPVTTPETTTEEVVPEAPTTTEATTSVVAEEVIAEPETSSGVRHLFVNNKVTVLDPHNLTKGEKANIEAVVRKTNHLTNNHVVFVAQDGSVDVLENGEEIGRLSSEEVVEVLTARKPEAESMTETPDVTEAPEAPETTEASAENGTIGTAGVISEVKLASTETSPAATEPVTPEAPDPAEKTTPTVDIEALRAEKVALLNTYSLLTPTVKGEFLTRFQQAVDAAALNAIAEEARKIQEREGATKRSEFPITGRAFYPKPLGLMAQESLQQEPIPQAILAAAEENAEKAPTEGRMVTPEVSVTSSHRGISPTPTIYNDKTRIDFKFGKQKLYKGDYFFVETQDVPVPFPDTFRLKSENGEKDKVIATVERVGYESDFVKGSNSEDPSRFDLKNDETTTTMKIKYKVTFTEAVEGLEDVTATVSGNGGKQTLGATAERKTLFKVNVNGNTVYTGSYSLPKWDDANAHQFKRSPFNTGKQGKVTEGLHYTDTEITNDKGKKEIVKTLEYGEGDRSKTEYDDGKPENEKALHPYVNMEATVYDYRTNNPKSNVKFLTETKSDGLVQLTGQVGGMPNGFLMTIESPKSEEKNRFTWDKERLQIGKKLPVYYMPFEDVDTHEQNANADNKKLFVTPNGMYYTIKEISDDGRKITLQFHGDYTKPGRIVTSFENPMKEASDKTSRLGLNFDKTEWKNVNNSQDNSLLSVSHPDGTEIKEYDFKATSKKNPSSSEVTIRQRGVDALTSKAYRLNYDASATGVPVTVKNPDQIGKGTVIVRYVDENGKTIQAEQPVINNQAVELQDGTKTRYNTATDAYRPKEIEADGKKYTLAPKTTVDNTYLVGTVSDQGNLTKSNLRDVVASTDPTGADPEGELTQGTKYITYVYKEVPPTPKTGKVIVKYENTDGEEIKDEVVDTEESPVGTKYETHDKREEKITSKDGKTTYYLKNIKEKSDPEEGAVKDGITTVTYVYEKAGSVVVKYVDENGVEISKPKPALTNAKPKTLYNVTTTDLRPTEIKKDDKVYQLVSQGQYKAGMVDKDGHLTNTDDVNGYVESGKTKSITYVYKEVKEEVPAPQPPAEKKGSVVVHYVNEAGEKIHSDYEDTKDALVSSGYNAADGELEKPTTIYHNGKTYKFKKLENSNTVNGKEIAPKSLQDYIGEEQGKVREGTTHVIYVYEEVPTEPNKPDEPGEPTPPVTPEAPKTGSVQVNYVDENGESIKASVYDEKNQPHGTEYDTTDDNRLTKLLGVDGNIYEIVKEGTLPVGSVDGNGRLVAPKEGQLWPSSDTESGTVEGGKLKQVTYVYKKVEKDVPKPPETPKPGKVVVHYVDTEGNTIKEDYVDTPETKSGTVYDATEDSGKVDEKPDTIISKDGKPYHFNRVSQSNYVGVKKIAPIDESNRIGEEKGTVTPGTTHVIYVYQKEVPVPTPPAPTPPVEKKGSVVVHYVNEKGETIHSDYVDTKDVPAGETYDAAENDLEKPEFINHGGKTYQFKEFTNANAVNGKVLVPNTDTDFIGGDKGKVFAGTTHVIYVYKEVPATPDKPGQPNEPKPPVTPEAPKPGSVIVNYIDENGHSIKAPVFDEKNQPEGTSYDTADDNRPKSILTDNGKIYDLIQKAGDQPVGTIDGFGRLIKAVEGQPWAPSEAETGTVTGGVVKQVTYVYKLREDVPTPPKEEKKGSVTVKYEDTEGNEIKDPVKDTDNAPVGTVYETHDNKPPTIKKGDSTYYLTKKEVKEDSAPEKGKVEEGEKVVTYVYEKSGNVVVNYKDTAGNVIKDPVDDEKDAKPGSPYDTTDNRPEEIKTPDGKTYKRVPKLTEGDEKGEVPSGKTTKVTYVYEEVKGKVIVHYIDLDGKTIKDDVVDTPETSTGVDYNTADDNKPATIEKDGKTYELVPVLTKGHEQGKVVAGTTEVTYVYRVKETPQPEAPKEKVGSVVVKYENTKGESIATPINDTVNAKVGTEYDTTDYKPEKIYKDGKTYIYKEVKQGSVDEKGKVVEGTQTVTYVYEEEVVPPTPGIPEKPGSYIPYVPNNPQNPDPNDPDKSIEIPKVPYDETPEDPSNNPPLPDVDGYIPVDPKDPTTPLKPKDPEDPTKGYTPPTIKNPEDPSEDTPVPYVPAGTVTVHYVDEKGNPIKDPTVDTPKSPVGTDYNTNENGTEIPKEVKGKDGKDYVLVKVKDGDKEIGKVVKGNTDVTYIYKVKETPEKPDPKKPGSYIPYVPNNPQNPDPNDPDKSIEIPKVPYDETPEDPSNNPPLPDVDGYIPVDPKDPTTPLKPKDPEDPTKGYTPPTIKNPEDPSEDTPVPYVPAGTVTVHYVDEKGNPIKDPTVDTPKSPVGTDYNTNENGTEIPKEVKGKDGKDYVLVKVKDGDKEIGKVVKGNTDVTYIYKVKETSEKPDPNDPQGPKDPEGPKDPQEPNVPEKPEKPGNPEDPSMPEAPKEKPTPEKPAEPGQPTPEQPGQNKGEVKKSAVLPNTGEASTMIGWSAAALSILAGLGLVATGRKKEDEEA